MRTSFSVVSRSDKLLAWEISCRDSQGHVKLVALLALLVGECASLISNVWLLDAKTAGSTKYL